MAEVILSEASFEAEVLKSDLPVMVDFWAEWCGPCRVLGPIVEELAKEWEGKMKVGKVNVDENNALAGKYEVQGIPSLIFFKGGEVVHRSVGLKMKDELNEEIKKVVA